MSFKLETFSPSYRLSPNHLPDKLHYLKLVYLHARAILGLKRKARKKRKIYQVRRSRTMKWSQTKINEYTGGRSTLGPKMKQMIPLSLSIDQPTRLTAIPSFHPDIDPFHRKHQSSSMPPSMSSVKYILATKSSFLSSSWTSSGGLLAIRFVRMAADGVVAEGGIISRVSCLVLPSLSDGSSVFLLRCGSLRE